MNLEAFTEVRRQALERRDAAMCTLRQASYDTGVIFATRGIENPSAIAAVERLERAANAWEASERTSASELKAVLLDAQGEPAKCIDRYIANLELLSWNYWRVVVDMRKMMVAQPPANR